MIKSITIKQNNEFKTFTVGVDGVQKIVVTPQFNQVQIMKGEGKIVFFQGQPFWGHEDGN
jgi:hypothetical protein